MLNTFHSCIHSFVHSGTYSSSSSESGLVEDIAIQKQFCSALCMSHSLTECCCNTSSIVLLETCRVNKEATTTALGAMVVLVRIVMPVKAVSTRAKPNASAHYLVEHAIYLFAFLLFGFLSNSDNASDWLCL